ncbi:Holliday junction resolvase RuvX [Patescibacteria group bacterium]|nr:Holliday junction resolvase RuvX [Patescibacteria group bacterium]
MSTILAIDYGTKYLGLALGLSGGVNSPLKAVSYHATQEAVELLRETCNQYEVNQIILGLPLRNDREETQARQVKIFGKLLEDKLGLPIDYVDETLTSADAVKTTVALGIPRGKRRGKQHMFAAVSLLRRYRVKLEFIP